MAKDYAKKFSKNRNFVARGWRVRLLLVIFLVLVASGIIYGIKLFKKESVPKPALIVKIQDFFHKKKIVSVEAKPAIIEEIPKKPEIQFNFYTELPKVELTSPAPKLVTTTVKNQYLVQVGSFPSEALASETRISLLLAGIEVQIIKKSVDNRWQYILQKGPYASMVEAKKIQTKLKSKGYENVKIFSL